MSSRLLPLLSLLALLGAACGGGGGEITFKAHEKPLETAKITTALTNGKHIDLFLGGCKVGCEIYQGATCTNCVNRFALEKACGADARYVEVKLQNGDIAPGHYPMEKISVLLQDNKLGANLLYDAKKATLDIKSPTEASFTADYGGKGTFTPHMCK